MAFSPYSTHFYSNQKNQHTLNFLSIGIMSSNRLFSGIAFENCDVVVSVSTLFPFTCSA